MRNHLVVVLAAVFAVSLAAPAVAQQVWLSPNPLDDNISGLRDQEAVAGTIFETFTAFNNHFAAKYLCSDATGTSTSISCAVADCCAAGDVWRCTIFKGNAQSRFKHTGNLPSSVGPAFPPDVFSPNATITTSVNNVSVLVTAGNNLPAGLPAGGTLRVTTNGGGPTCNPVQVVNGTP